MDQADVLRYIDQAAEIDTGPSALCFSGGEVFLYYDLLRTAIAHAASRFQRISVITNGFWALRRDVAIERLSDLKGAGLTTLIVSVSPFHTRYVKPERLRKAVAAAHELGLETFVKATGPSDGPPTSQLLEAIGPLPADVQVDTMTFLPGGRACDLPPTSFSLQTGIPEGRCPGAVFTIHPNGDAYYCCTPGAFTDALRLGNALHRPLRDLVNEYYFGGLFAFLREQGPAGFVPALRHAGLGGKLADQYVDVCHLCTSLVNDPEALQVIDRVSEDYEADLFARIASRAAKELVGGYQ